MTIFSSTSYTGGGSTQPCREPILPEKPDPKAKLSIPEIARHAGITVVELCEAAELFSTGRRIEVEANAIRLLRRLEWAGTSFAGEDKLAIGDSHPGYEACPDCVGVKEYRFGVADSEIGHRPGCELARRIGAAS